MLGSVQWASQVYSHGLYSYVLCSYGPYGYGAMGLAVYLLGLPVSIYFILMYIRKNKLHTDRRTMAAFGNIYTKYEAHSWWYELIQVRVEMPCRYLRRHGFAHLWAPAVLRQHAPPSHEGC